MKAEATPLELTECAYCSRQLGEHDSYLDLAPSGPVVYCPQGSLRIGRILPVRRVICEDCQEERARMSAGDYGTPVTARPGLLFREFQAAL
ncbi:MAG: hypothetical protein AABZ64_01545 [Nitrospinota bacterium]